MFLCGSLSSAELYVACRHGIALIPGGRETIIDASMIIKNIAVIGASDYAGACPTLGAPLAFTVSCEDP